ncbi:LysR family transcriptional regulator [Sphingopyxis granuli]|jgi:DNA-binding transcriptional LysR family regulator|uniref:LysR family transcriptional regulator n=1 Tax=Sphingopyxis granuli TaxID=267128 RepID=UPI00301C11CB
MASKFNCELLDLRSFVAVYETRSFSRAARLLNQSQPALSRRIQRLEALVGGPLFERTSRSLAETALGKELLPVAHRALDLVDTSLFASRNVREPRWIDITIACVQTAAFHVLPRAARTFMEENPRIRLRVLDVPAVEAADLVASGEAEFGISIESLLPTALRFEALHEDPFGLACHRSHPLADLEILDWSRLKGESLIAVHRASRNRTLLDAELARCDISLDWRYEVAHLTTALGLIAARVGVAVMPRMVMPRSGRSEVVWRPVIAPVVQRTIGIVHRRAGSMHPAALQLLTRLREAWPSANLGDSESPKIRRP